MRHLRCRQCARTEPRGRYTIPPGPDGPAESYRVIDGTARAPTPGQRTISITTPAGIKVEELTRDHYDCDLCGAAIRPGDPAVAITAWQPSRQQEPPSWEGEYLNETIH
jgi:hypothetical protein